MIAWQHPGAFVALLALAAPLVIHLLQRRRATRILFPSDRFVHPSVTGAVRLRLPADLALLVLRLAIVTVAVCALAQPVIVDRARMSAWNARIARAVVVDVSESMKRAAGAAATAAGVELRSASHAVRIESADLADGVRRAASSLGDAPPARREIIVISDFQSGALAAPVLQGIPESIGVRFVRVGDPAGVRQTTGPPLLAVGGRGLRAEIAVHADRTSVSFVDRVPESGGLRIAGATESERNALLESIASSGAPAPAAAEPIVVRFGKTEGRKDGRSEGWTGGRAEEERWMLETALRLRSDPDLATAAADSPAFRLGTSGDALVLDIDAPSESFVAAAAVRGALAARHRSPAHVYAEHEVRTIADEELRAWSREAPDVTPDVWRHAQQTDARWFWLLVLVLLGVETFVRARGAS